MSRLCVLAMTALLSWATAASAQEMTQDQLAALTANGVAVKLGGEGHGYSGVLDLKADGTGAGSAKTDDGREITIAGTWAIRDGKFCRTWADLDGGAEVCETWVMTSETSADVFNGEAKIGVNSW